MQGWAITESVGGKPSPLTPLWLVNSAPAQELLDSVLEVGQKKVHSTSPTLTKYLISIAHILELKLYLFNLN